MKKRLFAIGLFLFVTTQIFSVGLKLDMNFGSKTNLFDFGVTFGDSGNGCCSTGFTIGSVEAYDKYYNYDNYHGNYEGRSYSPTEFGVFFDYTYNIMFLKLSDFTLGTELGLGVRYFFISNMGFDLYPCLGLVLEYKKFSLNLGYEFVYRIGDDITNLDNCFNLGLKYHFGSKKSKENLKGINDGPKYHIIDSDMVRF